MGQSLWGEEGIGTRYVARLMRSSVALGGFFWAAGAYGLFGFAG